jgi:hypothetical protein
MFSPSRRDKRELLCEKLLPLGSLGHVAAEQTVALPRNSSQEHLAIDFPAGLAQAYLELGQLVEARAFGSLWVHSDLKSRDQSKFSHDH